MFRVLHGTNGSFTNRSQKHNDDPPHTGGIAIRPGETGANGEAVEVGIVGHVDHPWRKFGGIACGVHDGGAHVLDGQRSFCVEPALARHGTCDTSKPADAHDLHPAQALPFPNEVSDDRIFGFGVRILRQPVSEVLGNPQGISGTHDADADTVVAGIEYVGAVRRGGHQGFMGVLDGVVLGDVFGVAIEAQPDCSQPPLQDRLADQLMGQELRLRHERGMPARCLGEMVVDGQAWKTCPDAFLVDQLHELLLGGGLELLGCGGDGEEEEKT